MQPFYGNEAEAQALQMRYTSVTPNTRTETLCTAAAGMEQGAKCSPTFNEEMGEPA